MKIIRAATIAIGSLVASSMLPAEAMPITPVASIAGSQDTDVLQVQYGYGYARPYGYRRPYGYGYRRPFVRRYGYGYRRGPYGYGRRFGYGGYGYRRPYRYGY